MRYTETDGCLKDLYLENSNVNWVEGTLHLWGECVCPIGITAKVNRTFFNNVLSEEYVFTNVTENDIKIEKGDLGIWATFNDSYEGAKVCKDKRCHAHIWLGGSCSWVNALAMKAEPPHFALMLTKGSLCAYSQERENCSNDRGDILLLSSPITIKAGESYVIAWDLFEHNGDFTKKAKTYPNYLNVESDYFTFFENEEASVLINGEKTVLNNELGYHTVNVGTAYFRYQIKPQLLDLAYRRCKFIMDYQQETNNSFLNGAYLIYDNEDKCRYFEEKFNANHNAGRERIAMGLLMAKYLQRNYDADLHNSLKKYTAFVLREYFDEETGKVINRAFEKDGARRIYNNAWYASFWRELYKLEKDVRWAKCMFKAYVDLYENGGKEFYPLSAELTDTIRVLESANLINEKEILLNYFIINADFLLKQGTDYPNFEVNYEDNIVIPAGVVLVQAYELTGNKRYLEEAIKHAKMHDIFVGFQPDARMHGASVHHWDDFWFGKRRMYGDTYPHYWSTAGAMLYAYMSMHTDNKEYIQKARACLRTGLSSFFDDGSATCAIVTPYKINGMKGEFIDPWANDQDWALYHALVFDEEFGL